MQSIKVLDTDTINKIAAGEVIDRPASVVKELVENAIDAKATAITIEIKDGGTSFIRITDNGNGIDKDDIKTAFLRHATSKIKTAFDLVSVSSLGFRGEALSSIAAVCEVELITKTKDSLNGIRYTINGGKEANIEQVGVPDGTTFIVKNIFYNTPARRKFLKSNITEAAYISDIVEKIALSHNDISFNFINNGNNKLHTSGNCLMKDSIYTIFGREIANNLLEAKYSNEEIQISGFIGKPSISRGNRNSEIYFINGRFIKSDVISRAIEAAYKEYMMQHQYPFCVLNIDIEPALLDVNVHPSKMEIRIKESERIFNYIKNTISNSLQEKELIPQAYIDEKVIKEEPKVAVKMPEPFEVNRTSAFTSKANTNTIISANDNNEQKNDNQKYINYTDEPKKDILKNKIITDEKKNDNKNKKVIIDEPKNDIQKYKNNTDEYKIDKEEKKLSEAALTYEAASTYKPMQESFKDILLSERAMAKSTIVGQIFDTYWIVQYEEDMYIIDQHAAHEKVNYERFMKQYRNNEVMSQRLNPPIVLELNSIEEACINKYSTYFKKMGYEIEPFGGSDYAVYGVPANIYKLPAKELLIYMIDNITDDVNSLDETLICEKIATMSCKAAIKGNTRITEVEARTLINELMTLENPYNCPHGRPVIIKMSKYEIEKKFKRII